MIKDIKTLPVEDVGIAIVQEMNELNEKIWDVYIVNFKDELLEGVLVSSTGYGTYNGTEVKTSTLRHFLDEMPPKSFKKVEPIAETVFGLNNEYWFSFYINKVMYDKKVVFLPETISEDYLRLIPIIEKRGVLIK
jgi:hypothetical protein